ncbi:MAG: methyltransferase domain-containing protein [Myxococcota bacterium]|nr:methyltransferase domain-containing protein [Myxococcota bacterium]
MATGIGDRLRFFGRFFLRPKVQGALQPSSIHLVEELLRGMDIETAQSLAELGPGTGVATRVLLERKALDASLLAIEKDAQWVRLLRRRYPELDLVHGDASELAACAEERSLAPFDAVICGLPFAMFDEQLQRSILAAVSSSLKPGGGFTTFAYVHGKELPSARRFSALLNEYFESVESGQTIWRNTPPAMVYKAWSRKETS